MPLIGIFTISGAIVLRAEVAIRAEFHPLVTPMIPFITRSSPDPDAASHDMPRKEKQ